MRPKRRARILPRVSDWHGRPAVAEHRHSGGIRDRLRLLVRQSRRECDAPAVANDGVAGYPAERARISGRRWNPRECGARNVGAVAQARALTAAYLPTQLPPYAIQWNIGVQRVVKNDYTVEVRYLGTRGVHLINQTRINMQSVVGPTVFLPTFLQRPSQGELDSLQYALEDLKTQSFFLPQYEAAGFSSPITSYLPRGNSIYHGLAAEVTRRFARGVLVQKRVHLEP